MECRKHQRWIEDEASADLGARERALLDAHAASCPACRARRAGEAALARDLALAGDFSVALRSVPEVDVRARVMRGVALEVEAARLRARVRMRVLCVATAASIATLGGLALLMRRAAAALPDPALPASQPLQRLIHALWTALKPALTGVLTLGLGLLDTALYALRAAAEWMPLAEAAAAALVGLVLIAAALPVVRALRPAPPLRRGAER